MLNMNLTVERVTKFIEDLEKQDGDALPSLSLTAVSRNTSIQEMIEGEGLSIDSVFVGTKTSGWLNLDQLDEVLLWESVFFLGGEQVHKSGPAFKAIRKSLCMQRGELALRVAHALILLNNYQVVPDFECSHELDVDTYRRILRSLVWEKLLKIGLGEIPTVKY